MISETPLNQVGPTSSEAECSTSSEDLNNHLESEYAPQIELNPDHPSLNYLLHK